MSDTLKISNLLLNISQVGIEDASLTFSIENYSKRSKFLIFGIKGIYRENKLEFYHRLPLDFITEQRFSEHQESFVTEEMLRHLFNHLLSQKHTIDRNSPQ